MTHQWFSTQGRYFRKLIALDVKSFQISLDGTEEMHKQTRIRLNREGLIQPLFWNNLLSAKNTDLDFSITLRIHIPPDNVDDMYKLIDLI